MVQELSTYSTNSSVHVLVSHNSSGNKRSGANWMTTFEVTDDVIRGNESFSDSIMRMSGKYERQMVHSNALDYVTRHLSG